MPVNIDWAPKIIHVPKDAMDLIAAGLYQLDLDTFRLALKSLEDGDEGIIFEDTHIYTAPTTLGGVTFARRVEIINGYTVTFEDDQYGVNVVGGNSNIADVLNRNQVSVLTANSAGLTANLPEQLFDEPDAIESGLTFRQAMRFIAAAMAGNVTGGGTTTVTIRDVGDTKSRIVATVDNLGNRTVTFLDKD